MQRTKLGAVLGGVTAAVVVATTAGPAVAGPQAAPHAVKTAVYVNGVAVGPRGGSMAVDRDGGEHILVHRTDGLAYATKLPGDAGFTATSTSYPWVVDGLITPTVSGTDLDVVLTTCHGTKVFQIPDSARSLPQLSSAKASVPFKCGQPDMPSGPAEVIHATSLDDGQIALTFLDQSGVYLGFPGKPFTKLTVPSTVPDPGNTTMCGDPAGDRVFVAQASSSGKLGLATLQKSNGSWRWSTSQAVPLPGFTGGDEIELASSHLQVWALVLGSSSGDVLLTVHRDSNGHWSQQAGLPGGEDFEPIIEPATNSAVAGVWVAANQLKDGSSYQVNTREDTDGGGWSAPTTIQGATSLIDMTVDQQGQPVVEYSSQS